MPTGSLSLTWYLSFADDIPLSVAIAQHSYRGHTLLAKVLFDDRLAASHILAPWRLGPCYFTWLLMPCIDWSSPWPRASIHVGSSLFPALLVFACSLHVDIYLIACYFVPILFPVLLDPHATVCGKPLYLVFSYFDCGVLPLPFWSWIYPLEAGHCFQLEFETVISPRRMVVVSVSFSFDRHLELRAYVAWLAKIICSFTAEWSVVNTSSTPNGRYNPRFSASPASLDPLLQCLLEN